LQLIISGKGIVGITHLQTLKGIRGRIVILPLNLLLLYGQQWALYPLPVPGAVATIDANQ